ncbi:MAG: NAD(P)/FAD-dependent oxidoreductase [Chloroflexi bacterium]|nr:MAG: NAD(P)/FAD-dependent oxidoreductase [Chloroflexota bacterium]
MNNSRMGPLQDGGHVVIIGGGPGGSACAIALCRLAQSLGREIKVTVYEGKTFQGERHYNQCVGVVSPPIQKILEDELGIPFPWHLVQRLITAYVLHGEHRSLSLSDVSEEPSYALRRVTFDAYLLEQAEAAGARVVRSRVTDVEVNPDGVIIYSESDNRRADVLIGAFGLDTGTAAALARATPYRPPQFLDSIVTKVHPPDNYPEIAPAPPGQIPSGRIHAFLPATSHIEFGAVSPKGNHLTVNIAGAHVTAAWMDYFLQGPARDLLTFVDPEHPLNPKDFRYFKGRFPISVAKGFYGNRYVTVGDAAGLVRAFKGKGINSACLTGLWAARAILTAGISARAFERSYVQDCREILSDIPYGHLVRQIVINASRLHQVDRALALAEDRPILRQALFDAVSGRQPYRTIIRNLLSSPIEWLGWRRSLEPR